MSADSPSQSVEQESSTALPKGTEQISLRKEDPSQDVFLSVRLAGLWLGVMLSIKIEEIPSTFSTLRGPLETMVSLRSKGNNTPTTEPIFLFKFWPQKPNKLYADYFIGFDSVLEMEFALRLLAGSFPVIRLLSASGAGT